MKREEHTTLFATVIAVSLSFAPDVIHSISFVAPSPSFASILVRLAITSYKADLNISNSAVLSVISLFSAIPLAIKTTISFVDVSPSIDRQLYVTLTISDNASCNSFEDIAQSDVIKFRVVAIFG